MKHISCYISHPFETIVDSERSGVFPPRVSDVAIPK